jgi:hypothetical protein
MLDTYQYKQNAQVCMKDFQEKEYRHLAAIDILRENVYMKLYFVLQLNMCLNFTALS